MADPIESQVDDLPTRFDVEDSVEELEGPAWFPRFLEAG